MGLSEIEIREEINVNATGEDNFLNDEYQYMFISDDGIEFGNHDIKCHLESIGYKSVGLGNKAEADDIIEELQLRNIL